ncbi:NADase-type glycan-binding domain-containing protein [Nocardioides zhouii]|uniref:NAD glycohydrolase translocation F5/8 type C domain-containing protein n=1 Tax=Nocardioides zhouii TaxID=1168729 RepID=A0A4Q2SIY1_9ACTN|nr:hypothetical protein [Nocardioides zhouii]RYC05506.1 hypothetical protein EUA94_18940 [Nocardioides zhouii]
MDTCVRCGADLGVGRFCLNCGHPIGEPAPVAAPPPPVAVDPGPPPAPADAPPEPTAFPVQAADPTPVAPVADPLADPVAPVAPAPPPRTPAPTAPAPARSAWDPERDLLPYEEVDALHTDDPVRGRAWIFWVLGAVLLVGLVVVLLEAFATDEDGTTASDPTSSASTAPNDTGDGESTEPDEEAEEAPKGVGKLVNLAGQATFEVPGTAPPTTDFDGNLVAYEASQMQDGNLSTTWRTAGDASGQAVTITLPEPGVVSRVGLVNGYTKQVAGVDWYPNNRRILSVTWGFDDGTSVEQTFSERPGMQRLKVPPVETSTITITITAVTPPGSGNLGRDYTAISEVAVIGRRAG